MNKRLLLSFDVVDDHARIIEELTAKGWHSIITGVDLADGITPATGYLPETTWWIDTLADERSAYNDFYTIAGKENVLRAFVFRFTNWVGSTTHPMKHQKEEQNELPSKAA